MKKLVLCLLLALSLTCLADDQKTINFQLTDVNGKLIKLSNFHGKWVLVNFWAPWCPLCWAEVPALNELNARGDLIVIGVGLDYGPDSSAVIDAIHQHDVKFTATIAGGSRRDPKSSFRQIGPVDFYPTSYLYDPKGQIVMFIPGQLKVNKVLEFIQSHR